MRSTYRITGMTCQHCATHITEDVLDVPGVDDAIVNLEEATLVVVSKTPVDAAAIIDAVSEAGDYSAEPIELT